MDRNAAKRVASNSAGVVAASLALHNGSEATGRSASQEPSANLEAIAAALVEVGLCPIKLRELETAAIHNALRQADGNRTRAAKSLGISVRTLQRKIRSWGAGDSH